MKRSPDSDRVRQLVTSATRLFIAQGYRRTQIADVAEDLGVAKGSIYLYVESKEALFDLAVRHTDSDAPIPIPAQMPVPTPKPGSTLAYVQRTLTERATFPVLGAALAATSRGDVREELRAIAEEVYDLLARNRQGLKLIDSCAADYPELGDLWFTVGRGGLSQLIEAYLRSRSAQLRPLGDVAITARLTLELLTLWAVHRHFDPRPQPMAEEAARAEAVEWVWRALAKTA